MQNLHFTVTVAAPREAVFALFADHSRFTQLFGSASRRRVDAPGDDANGLGSVRTIGRGLLAFDETIVRYQPPELIHYRITRGSPLKNHLGRIAFIEQDGQTLVDYRIDFDGRLPLIARLVAWMLRRQWRDIALPSLSRFSG